MSDNTRGLYIVTAEPYTALATVNTDEDGKPFLDGVIEDEPTRNGDGSRVMIAEFSDNLEEALRLARWAAFETPAMTQYDEHHSLLVVIRGVGRVENYVTGEVRYVDPAIGHVAGSVASEAGNGVG